jgi:hypothetical protein
MRTHGSFVSSSRRAMLAIIAQRMSYQWGRFSGSTFAVLRGLRLADKPLVRSCRPAVCALYAAGAKAYRMVSCHGFGSIENAVGAVGV